MQEVVSIAVQLAEGIRETVRPAVGLRAEAEKGGVSGDWQYLVDVKAERYVAEFFRELWRGGYGFAYLTEEQGLVLPEGGDADMVFVIDPVDGSRPAQRGLNTCNVVVGVAEYRGRVPRLCDVEVGVVSPLTEDATLVGIMGDGVYAARGRKMSRVEPTPSRIDSLDQCFVDIEVYNMPLEVMGVVYSPVIESVNAYFVYHCMSYALLSLARGTVEAVIDARLRVLEEFPSLAPAERPKLSSTLDIAGLYPITRAAGVVVTDAYGRPLDHVPLWEGRAGKPVDISCLAASSPVLHSQMLSLLQRGLEQLGERGARPPYT